MRHFARQKGVNLASIPNGTGKGGRIEKKDVEMFLSSLSSLSESPQLSIFSEQPREDIHVELGRTRFAMWKAMTKVIDSILCINCIANLFPELGNSPLWIFYHARLDKVIGATTHA